MFNIFKPQETDEIYYDNDKGIFTSKPKTYPDSLAGWYLEQLDKEEAAKVTSGDTITTKPSTELPIRNDKVWKKYVDSSNNTVTMGIDPAGLNWWKSAYENCPDAYRVFDSKGQATRHNKGKVELYYLFDCPLANEAKCRAAMFGAAKYNQNNWRKGLPVSNLLNSALRHLQSYVNGETLDTESGINHLGHVLWNIEKAMEFSLTKPELDDRFKPTTTNGDNTNETI